MLVNEVIEKIRIREYRWTNSPIKIYVERNLGFEAEHHERALRGIEGVVFRRDVNANRIGVYTTNEIKHAMCTLLNNMLREERVCILPEIVSREPEKCKAKLRDQLSVYSYQFKQGQMTFQKDQVAISGKIGGMADDICICLQLGAYFSNHDTVHHDNDF